MSKSKSNKHLAKVLAVVFALVLTVSVFAPSATTNLSAARFSFVGEDSNVTTNIKLNGKDTGAIYTRVHLGSGGSAGYGANRIINIVEANPSQYPNLSFEVINSGTYNKNAQPLTSEVAKFAEKDKTILAAVNGDWMQWVNSLGASVPKDNNYRVSFSPLVMDGEICCSQMTAIEMAADYYTMCISKDNKIVIDKPTVSTKIQNITTGKTVTPTGLNRAPVNNSLNVYNNRLNDSNYVSTDAYEVVIKTDTTNKFYQKQAVTGTVINIYPAGTTNRCGLTDDIVILTARGSKISTLESKFSIGDKVSITAEIKCGTNKAVWENCEEAIGGQCLVMKGGKINNDLSGGDMGNYPTNIIGYKKDGTIMMSMVTADQHGTRSGLIFEKDIAKFCKEVGYDTCFLFDGGGSTTMVTLDNGKYVERACYSEGVIRNTWNGLALVYDENINNTPATPTPTKAPTPTPTKTPVKTPTKAPTKAPTQSPTKAPTNVPTVVPTETLAATSTVEPTVNPTVVPTEIPTEAPTEKPVESSTTVPTVKPSEAPKNDSKDNTGTIITVVVCAVVVVAAIVVLVIFLKKK